MWGWFCRIKHDIPPQDENNCICFFQCVYVCVSVCVWFHFGKSTLLIRKLCSFCFPNQSIGHGLGHSYLTESQDEWGTKPSLVPSFNFTNTHKNKSKTNMFFQELTSSSCRWENKDCTGVWTQKEGIYTGGKGEKMVPSWWESHLSARYLDVLTHYPLSTRLWWKGPRLLGSYWASSAQGFMAVMEMLCPLHLKTPASHSDIVSSLPFTTTQMLYPASWHSKASLQTHLLFWASHLLHGGHAPQAFSADAGGVQLSLPTRV